MTTDYKELSLSGYIGVGIPIEKIPVGFSVGIGGFVSSSDIRLMGDYVYFGFGVSLDVPVFDLGSGELYYYPMKDPKSYDPEQDGTVNKGGLILDILSGYDSPWLWMPNKTINRLPIVVHAMIMAEKYEKIGAFNANNK